MKDKLKITMLGTGNAVVTKCYNTCFAIINEEQTMLVDAGGGNGILSQLEKADIKTSTIHDIFVTHAHTDHILGVVWVIRIIAQQMQQGKYSGILNIYAHDKSIEVLDWICKMTLPKKITCKIGSEIIFNTVSDGDTFEAINTRFTCFDILSTKEKQYGFKAILPDKQTLVCLGDEPFNEANRKYVENSDWMMCEAFCLYKDREVFKPYEKHHSTALDTGKLAGQLNIKNLILYHTEDRTIKTRKKEYTSEAANFFNGNIYVPEDLETINLTPEYQRIQ